MASSTTAGPTLLPSPRPETDQSQGFHYFWLLAAIIVGATAVLTTWVVSRPDTNTGAATTSITGGLSPRAADHLDAQVLERTGTTSIPVSPRAADFQDARSGVQRANSTQPVSPNAVDRVDASQQSSLYRSPTAVDRVNASSQQQSSAQMSPAAADYLDRREPQ